MRKSTLRWGFISIVFLFISVIAYWWIVREKFPFVALVCPEDDSIVCDVRPMNHQGEVEERVLTSQEVLILTQAWKQDWLEQSQPTVSGIMLARLFLASGYSFEIALIEFNVFTKEFLPRATVREILEYSRFLNLACEHPHMKAQLVDSMIALIDHLHHVLTKAGFDERKRYHTIPAMTYDGSPLSCLEFMSMLAVMVSSHAVLESHEQNLWTMHFADFMMIQDGCDPVCAYNPISASQIYEYIGLSSDAKRASLQAGHLAFLSTINSLHLPQDDCLWVLMEKLREQPISDLLQMGTQKLLQAGYSEEEITKELLHLADLAGVQGRPDIAEMIRQNIPQAKLLPKESLEL